MKNLFIILQLIFLFNLSPLLFSQEITDEEWQKQMDSLTLRKNQLLGDIFGLDKIVDSLKSDNTKLDSLLSAKKNEMYKILNVSSYQVSEYKKKFWDLYNRIENRIGDYESLSDELEEISKSRIRLLYEFRRPFEKMREYLDNFHK